IWK
ncbi:Transcriptional regulatory protein TyrR, partial [Haemophilus influenzae]